TMLFDVASRQVCTVKQSQTNTPLHALTLLNDVTYLEAARVLAARVMQEAASPEDRISQMVRLLAARRPNKDELGILRGRYETLRAAYQQDSEAATKLISVGESAVAAHLDRAELAALSAIATVIMNLDETQTKE